MFKKFFLFLFMLSIVILNVFSGEILFPLVINIVSAIPIISDDIDNVKIIGFLNLQKKNLFFSIKDNRAIKYWEFDINNLAFKQIPKTNNVERPEENTKKIKIIKIIKNKLVYYVGKKKIWQRDAPKIEIQDYFIADKSIIIIYKNGLLNIFSNSGTLSYWKTLDYKAKYIVNSKYGVFIFSEKKYYYFDKKEKKIKEGKLNMKIFARPIVIDNTILIWGIKQGAKFFVVEKLSSARGVEINYDKVKYFKGEKIKLEIKEYNLKKLRTSVNLISEKANIEIAKKSKKKKFSIYVPSEGKNILILSFVGENYEKRIKLIFIVKDKEKIILNLLNKIYKKCYLTGEKK